MFDEDLTCDIFIRPTREFHQQNQLTQSDKPNEHSSSFSHRTARCHTGRGSTFQVTSKPVADATTTNFSNTSNAATEVITKQTNERLNALGGYDQFHCINQDEGADHDEEDQRQQQVKDSRASVVVPNPVIARSSLQHKYGRLSSLSFNSSSYSQRLNRANSISNCSNHSQTTLNSSLEQQQPQSFTNMIAKLASNTSVSQKPTQSQMMTSATAQAKAVPLASAQSKRKRSKLLDILLNTNWSKQSQQASNLMKLNKVLLFCDANFLDEKTGESPLSLAITSPQINELQTTAKSNRLRLIGSNGHTTSNGIASCPQSTSLFDLQNQHSTTSHNQLTLRQTSAVEISQSKAPLVERILLLLIKSGVMIDFRNSDGRTPLHVAAMKSNFWALKTLLDLGASTDCSDTNGLNPLFYSVLHKAELKVTQLLLNHISLSNSNDANSQTTPITNGTVGGLANPGISDQHGWQAIHYAAKYGLSGHTEKLLYYGCDINARISGSGNTPLHVAAINDQLQVAQVLLLRGADKEITNNSHQTAHQVAVVSNNMDLAEFIASHDDTKVSPFADRRCSLTGRNSLSIQSRSVPHGSNRSSISSNQHILVRPDLSSARPSSNFTGNNSHVLSQRPGAVQLNVQRYPDNNSQPTQADRQHQMNTLTLDVASHYASSASSSAPTTNTSGTSHQTARSSLLSIDTSSINHNQQLNVQVSNISPCLSQRSCATSNTTTTSSSGVCCDGDGHNSEDLNSRPEGNHSNVTVISIANGGSGATRDAHKVQYRASCDEKIASSFRNNAIVQTPYQSNSVLQSDGQLKEACLGVNGTGANDDVGNQSGSESSSSSDGLHSLMSDTKPLYVGSIVKATNCYESGDPKHLQLRREDLVEILECPPDLIQDGQLPRLANKPMLYGRRRSDGASGLFPSFCVRRSKQRLTAPRRPMQEVTNLSAQQRHQSAMATTTANECQQSCNAVRGTNLPESQSMASIGLAGGMQASHELDDRHLESSRVSFREFRVTLDKINEGFGFVLRGARIDPATLSSQSRGDSTGKISIDENLMAANKLASLQYFSDIEPNSIAHQSGLKRGDFLVSVNGQDVRLCSHEQVVQMIRQSGDRVQLAVARTETILSDSAKTLTRVKPEPPKRDPNTTLTRNKAAKIKSMFVAPQQSSTSQMSNRFDADKPLPETPVNMTSPTSLNRSVSTNLSHFSSANSLSSTGPDSQSVASISTVESGQLGPNSSSSTTTLTTVATTKPKPPQKPVDLHSKAQRNLDTCADLMNHHPAAVITSYKRQSQDETSPSTIPTSQLVKQSTISQMMVPPPPPPPMPDFSATPAMEKVNDRRKSTPIIQTTSLLNIDRNQLLKKRDSLASVLPEPNSSTNYSAAPMCAVAAACAAVANSRLQRQQQREQQQQQQQQEHEHKQNQQEAPAEVERKYSGESKDPVPEPEQNHAKIVSKFAPRTGSAKEVVRVEDHREPGENQTVEKSPKLNDAQINRRLSNHNLITHSATLGRKTSAQIIQQPTKPNPNISHSQTLKIVATKRLSILDHDMFPPPPPPTLPPPPMFAEPSYPSDDRELAEQKMSIHQQPSQHNHRHSNHQRMPAEHHRVASSERYSLNQMQLQNQNQMVLRQQQQLRQQHQLQEQIRMQQQQQQCPHHNHQVTNHEHMAQASRTLTRPNATNHGNQPHFMHSHHDHTIIAHHQSNLTSDMMATPAITPHRHQQYHDQHHSGQHYHHLRLPHQMLVNDGQRIVAQKRQQHCHQNHNHHHQHQHHHHQHQTQNVLQYQAQQQLLQQIDPRITTMNR